MKRALGKILCGATLLLGLPLMFTSCEEILGEWSKPAPVPGTPNTPTPSPTPTPASKTAGAISYATASLAKGSLDPTFTNELTITGDGTVTYSSSNEAAATVDPTTGEVTLVGAGTTSITATVSDSETYTYETNSASYSLEVKDGISYLEWDGTKFITQNVASSGCQVVTSSTTAWNGSKTYVVNGNVTISGDVTVSADSKLILCDGATLTINGKLYDSGTGFDLTIYAQSDGVKMGVLNASANMTCETDYTIRFRNLKIHGGKITATAEGASYTNCAGIVVTNLTMFGGDVTAQGNGYQGAAIRIGNTVVDIKNNAKLMAKGGDNSSGIADRGISSSNDATINVSDNASLTAIGGNGNYGGNAIEGAGVFQLNASGNALVTLTGGNSSGNAQGGFGVNGGTSGNVTASGNACLEITGGNGSIGGYGISPTLTISGNASVKAQGGDMTYSGGDVAGDAIEEVDYRGGSFTATGGVNSSDASKNGKGIKTSITNNSASAVNFEYSTDGTTWTTNSVAAYGIWDDGNEESRFVRTKP